MNQEKKPEQNIKSTLKLPLFGVLSAASKLVWPKICMVTPLSLFAIIIIPFEAYYPAAATLQ